jgi:DNA-binding IclR family transcriptional regulator
LGRLADDSEQVFERILRVRKLGYAYGGLSEDDDIRTVAISLPPNPNGIVLVIGATGPSAEYEQRRDEIAGVLKERAYHYLVAGGA